MCGEKGKFVKLTLKNGGFVTYGDNNKGKILGSGDVGNISSILIENVLYVEGLKHNLLSISQLCDKGFRITFESNHCKILEKNSDKICMLGKRIENIYMLDLDHMCATNLTCLMSKEDSSWLWHRRAAHINMNHLEKLFSKELVLGLPKLKFEKDKICHACQKGKQTKVSFNLKNYVSTTKPLELLHMDLFGPSRTMSIGGNYYALVIVDDYSRFTWTLFLKNKSDAFHAFKKLAKVLQNENSCSISALRSDHGGEFENEKFNHFCEKYGIKHNFSAPGTPQQNGVVERKNRSLEELARTMLNESNIPKYFWADAVNTACYIINRVLIRPILKKTPYELYKGRKPNIAHLRVFGCKCFVLNNGKEKLGKFDAKADDALFLGYSLHSKAYRIFNKRLAIIEESIHVVFDKTNVQNEGAVSGAGAGEENLIEGVSTGHVETEKAAAVGISAGENQKELTEILAPELNSAENDLPKEWRVPRNLSIQNGIIIFSGEAFAFVYFFFS